jgi:putative transcriptional regulator
MRDNQFEWDDNKAAIYLADHAVTFEMARHVFKDPFGIDQPDERFDYDEDRANVIGMVNGRLLFVAYTMRETASGSSQPEELNRMSTDNTTKTTPNAAEHDWSKFDAMTAEQRQAAAAADPDAQPLTPNDFARTGRTPQVKVIRRAFGLSQEDFAAQFQIPIGTLRDWEQSRKEPDAAAKAYLRVIAREPDAVRKALAPLPQAAE